MPNTPDIVLLAWQRTHCAVELTNPRLGNGGTPCLMYVNGNADRCSLQGISKPSLGSEDRCFLNVDLAHNWAVKCVLDLQEPAQGSRLADAT